MSFRSPWRHRPFVGAVALTRLLLRRWRGAEDAFIRFLVGRHNRNVERWLSTRRVSSVLLLLPRCVKRNDCTCDVRAVTGGSGDHPDVNRRGLAACRDCDRCPLGAVARFTEQYCVRAVVAYRSHIAYAIARAEQPDLIIAAACGDRLIKALRSVPEIPALLSPLRGMERPCCNANCDLDWIEGRLDGLVRTARSLGPVTATHPASASDLPTVADEGAVRSAEG
jgi:hypothetical protein